MKYLVAKRSIDSHWYNDDTQDYVDYDFSKSRVFDIKKEAQSHFYSSIISDLKNGLTLGDIYSPDINSSYSEIFDDFDKLKELAKYEDDEDWIGDMTFEKCSDKDMEKVVKMLEKNGIAPYEIIEIPS